jgi:hypothetical protein
MEMQTVSSHNRHERSVTRSVSLLVASALVVAAGAQAAETAHTPMVLTAFSNGAGGQQLLNGSYTEALAEIQHYRPTLMITSSAKATNLCVAYAATRQLAQAKVACDAALKEAKYDRIGAGTFAPGLSEVNAYVAIAYANRAVVHMLSRDEASAKVDLDKAQKLAPGADFVARNIAAVANARSTIAQLEVTPSR